MTVTAARPPSGLAWGALKSSPASSSSWGQPQQLQVLSLPLERQRSVVLDALTIPEDNAPLIDLMSIEQIEEHLASLDMSKELVRRRVKSWCLPLHKSLWDAPNGWWFHKKVDPIKMELPDYLEVIKEPMDLSTIRKRLDVGFYRELDSFARDVSLMFENAMTYNEVPLPHSSCVAAAITNIEPKYFDGVPMLCASQEDTDVHQVAKESLMEFRDRMDQLRAAAAAEIENARQADGTCPLCLNSSLKFEPVTYYCHGVPTDPAKSCSGRLRRNANYFCTGDYRWCVACYSQLPAHEPIEVGGALIYKMGLERRKNDEVNEEPMVYCDGCNRWVHQVCALFNNRRNTSEDQAYVCPRCVVSRLKLQKVAKEGVVGAPASAPPGLAISGVAADTAPDGGNVKLESRLLEAAVATATPGAAEGEEAGERAESRSAVDAREAMAEPVGEAVKGARGTVAVGAPVAASAVAGDEDVAMRGTAIVTIEEGDDAAASDLKSADESASKQLPTTGGAKADKALPPTPTASNSKKHSWLGPKELPRGVLSDFLEQGIAKLLEQLYSDPDSWRTTPREEKGSELAKGAGEEGGGEGGGGDGGGDDHGDDDGETYADERRAHGTDEDHEGSGDESEGSRRHEASGDEDGSGSDGEGGSQAAGMEDDVGDEDASDASREHGKAVGLVLARRRGRPPGTAAARDDADHVVSPKVLEATRASERQRDRASYTSPEKPLSAPRSFKAKKAKVARSATSSSGERASATFSNHFELKPGERPELTIRVVADSEKSLVVNERFLKRYGSSVPGGFPTEFPYRSKCIVLFQKVHGVDVIILVMFVYECGNECPEPNRNRAYISYLDSVNYFRPRHLRTALYHEMLVLYLDFIRCRGFRTAHIWVCPPLNKDDDYILFCHPEDQKIPKEDRLTTWYYDMLAKAERRGIVSAVSNIVDEYLLPKEKHVATSIPAFEVCQAG